MTIDTTSDLNRFLQSLDLTIRDAVLAEVMATRGIYSVSTPPDAVEALWTVRLHGIQGVGGTEHDALHDWIENARFPWT